MQKQLRAMVVASALAAPLLVRAVEIPVAGTSLVLRASLSQPGRRVARIVATDAAIQAPFPDLTTTTSALVLSAGAAPGQCRVEVALDPTKWAAIGESGTEMGYRYHDPAGGVAGVGRIVLRPGQLVVNARGLNWPCDLSAPARQPVTVELHVGDTRYCAAFGDAPVTRAGQFRARHSARPLSCQKTDLTVANLNILHGIFCPPQSATCRLTERIDLLFQWVVASGCPDVVTFQEVFSGSVPLINPKLSDTCPFPYQRVFIRSLLGLDDEMLLTRYPAVESELRFLYPGFRHVLYARIDHPIGAVDLFSTHLASGSDNAEGPCALGCPVECVAAGASTIRQCQSVQLAAFVTARHRGPAPAVITGDFNAVPGSFEYRQFVDRGWVDAQRAAGNPECDPDTGVGCTSGRADEDLSDLESPVSHEQVRIDYIFVVPPGEGSLCSAQIDTGDDADGDGTATRVFADDPNPFAPSCGPRPAPICWPSDHEGVQLDLNCD